MVEIVPPKGTDVGKELEGARYLKSVGVDAINIPDSPRASARMSNQALSLLVQQQVGIEAVLHYTCRDRNVLGIQSDLLGAAAIGIRNLICITGDPPKLGNYPDATAVFDVDSIGLTNVVSRLNRGCDTGGQPIGAPTAFHLGVSVNPAAPNLDEELRRFDYKVEAGAEFVLTRPIFDVPAFDQFLKRIAEFMANEVPGVRVPDRLLERMRSADGPEHASREGVAIAREIAAQLHDRVQGIQISTPSGNVDEALAVVEALR
jgi:homocysteine S-methyltransferase